ncbi:hypothetical protein BLNAU_9800 [Blattamonas nauphoetae]|uniref:C2H2-type domain-containing protein n=1 Tax=Blattamonas nauphoetae TaxID=2049346 RepID=A0ABQ9XUT8_9EUKA|nr:hypothetical protein BLNAU_9800 [Blattamonas nauphoetae]
MTRIQLRTIFPQQKMHTFPSFCNIHTNHNKGAAISTSISSTSSVWISSSFITNFKLSDGSRVGGAIRLFFEMDTATFFISDLHFTSNEATKAEDVFISTIDLSLNKKVLTAAKIHYRVGGQRCWQCSLQVRVEGRRFHFHRTRHSGILFVCIHIREKLTIFRLISS